MNTKILKQCEEAINEIIRVLRRGEVVVLASDNTYGLFANAQNREAVDKIYQLKGRDASKPLGLYINREKISNYAVVAKGLDKIIDLWPCPITIILPRKETVPDYVTKGYNSILMVCPDNYCIKLNRLCDFPITCTSANLSGQKAIVDFAEAYETFHGKVALIVDGGMNKHGQNGTIVDFSKEVPTILRIGPYSADEIRNLIPEVIIAEKLI
ncbi:L-threonylcarbamoyladenylate synthase [Desulfosporosinus sp. PR]|uniref:L-threonylcarbamoyladenylate synthase n=1 Tax=Candidatus Desulfosporosinus nitrosoreducens TaxID=3401928 RepID=UPI0027FE71FC|nr:L-threonylcarbamoyladenylate synthase [Desulfosporosinus sp. PR]MDQ7094869.1 L-threonylcarbamoyladenylate synthase [Desulfosporosinus sp. PR]